MTRNSSHKRFPRSAYVRRIWDIMDELQGWRRLYELRLEHTSSPVLRSKLEERIAGTDEVYHHLADAMSSWRLWT